MSNETYINDILYHFLPNFEIFCSIVKRGLLCSVGNKGKLDNFAVTLRETGATSFDVWQHPRICFTDIPQGHLAVHAQKYGQFGIGFARRTILEWGGAPVWYLNNHISANGAGETGGSILYQLMRFSNLCDNLITLVKFKNQKICVAQKLVGGNHAEDYIYGAMTSLYQMMSFVKEMSNDKNNNQKYLYEREWRIVSAKNNFFRLLLPEEKEELVRQNPTWGRPLDTIDADILERFESHPMIDKFFFFQGFPQISVSQAIEVVVVPDDAAKALVREFITQHKAQFRVEGPDIFLISEL